MKNENNEILLIASLQDLGHLYIATCLGSLFHSCIDLGKKENIKSHAQMSSLWGNILEMIIQQVFKQNLPSTSVWKTSSGAKRKMKIKLKIRYK